MTGEHTYTGKLSQLLTAEVMMVCLQGCINFYTFIGYGKNPSAKFGNSFNMLRKGCRTRSPTDLR